MDVQVFESIPHEIRAFQYAGEKLPWVHKVIEVCRLAYIEWIDGCHDDNENSGAFILYFDDWVILDENDLPLRVINRHDFEQFYQPKPTRS